MSTSQALPPAITSSPKSCSRGFITTHVFVSVLVPLILLIVMLMVVVCAIASWLTFGCYSSSSWRAFQNSSQRNEEEQQGSLVDSQVTATIFDYWGDADSNI